jgi:GxxExxY protein
MVQNEHFIHKDLTYKVIGCAMEVHRELGYGFLEKVYENAMMVQLKKEGVEAKQQQGVSVQFAGETVGEYFADILIEDKIIVELKAVDSLIKPHFAQVLNYLKATDIKLGLLLNFGPQGLQHKRFIY